MFRFEKRAPRNFTLGFEHGRYGDAWSLLHITTGITLGIVAFLLDWRLAFSLTILMFIMFIYELGEAMFDIVEDVENAITDVLFGGLGVFFVYAFDAVWTISTNTGLWLFGGLLVIDFVILYTGWYMYLERRLKEKSPAIQPAWSTKKGRVQNTRDHLYFLGFGISCIPLPLLIEQFGVLVAAGWFTLMVAVTVIARKAVVT